MKFLFKCCRSKDITNSVVITTPELEILEDRTSTKKQTKKYEKLEKQSFSKNHNKNRKEKRIKTKTVVQERERNEVELECFVESRSSTSRQESGGSVRKPATSKEKIKPRAIPQEVIIKRQGLKGKSDEEKHDVEQEELKSKDKREIPDLRDEREDAEEKQKENAKSNGLLNKSEKEEEVVSQMDPCSLELYERYIRPNFNNALDKESIMPIPKGEDEEIVKKANKKKLQQFEENLSRILQSRKTAATASPSEEITRKDLHHTERPEFESEEKKEEESCPNVASIIVTEEDIRSESKRAKEIEALAATAEACNAELDMFVVVEEASPVQHVVHNAIIVVNENDDDHVTVSDVEEVETVSKHGNSIQESEENNRSNNNNNSMIVVEGQRVHQTDHQNGNPLSQLFCCGGTLYHQVFDVFYNNIEQGEQRHDDSHEDTEENSLMEEDEEEVYLNAIPAINEEEILNAVVVENDNIENETTTSDNNSSSSFHCAGIYNELQSWLFHQNSIEEQQIIVSTNYVRVPSPEKSTENRINAEFHALSGVAKSYKDQGEAEVEVLENEVAPTSSNFCETCSCYGIYTELKQWLFMPGEEKINNVQFMDNNKSTVYNEVKVYLLSPAFVPKEDLNFQVSYENQKLEIHGEDDLDEIPFGSKTMEMLQESKDNFEVSMNILPLSKLKNNNQLEESIEIDSFEDENEFADVELNEIILHDEIPRVEQPLTPPPPDEIEETFTSFITSSITANSSLAGSWVNKAETIIDNIIDSCFYPTYDENSSLRALHPHRYQVQDSNTPMNSLLCTNLVCMQNRVPSTFMARDRRPCFIVNSFDDENDYFDEDCNSTLTASDLQTASTISTTTRRFDSLTTDTLKLHHHELLLQTDRNFLSKRPIHKSIIRHETNVSTSSLATSLTQESSSIFYEYHKDEEEEEDELLYFDQVLKGDENHNTNDSFLSTVAQIGILQEQNHDENLSNNPKYCNFLTDEHEATEDVDENMEYSITCEITKKKEQESDEIEVFLTESVKSSTNHLTGSTTSSRINCGNQTEIQIDDETVEVSLSHLIC